MTAPRVRSGAPLLPLAVLAALLAAFPFVLANPFFLNIGINVCVSAMVCVGLNLLAGHAGQISLGHAGFFGLGAYGAALLTTRAGVPPLASVLVTAAGVGVLAFAAARPILRLRGRYLAVATLGLGIIISIVLNREVWLTAGPDGLSIPAITMFGSRLRSQSLWYAVAAVALVITVWLAENLVHSPAGRALAALHSSEVAASTAGIDVARAKALVFTLSAVIASVGGSIFVFAGRFVTPAEASFLKSVEFVTMIVLGGLASSYGAIAGAAVLTALPQVFAPLADYTTIVLGLVLVVMMIALPRGVFPTLAGLLRRVRRGGGMSVLVQGRAAVGSALLSVESLSRRFGGVAAVDDVSFTVEPGRIHALIGPNGAGKTTLFNLVAGVLPPSSGRVLLGGQDVSGLTPAARARAGLQRTFQNLQVFTELSAIGNVMAGGHLRTRHGFMACLLGLPSIRRANAEAVDRAEALMRRVGLGAHLDSPASGLSYGLLKRLEIARALAAVPLLLLLDEPAAGLNHSETNEIGELIRSVSADGVTVLLVEHDMKLVMSLSDHIVVLDHGRKIAEGPPEAVRRDPAVVRAYLGGGGGARRRRRRG